MLDDPKKVMKYIQRKWKKLKDEEKEEFYQIAREQAKKNSRKRQRVPNRPIRVPPTIPEVVTLDGEEDPVVEREADLSPSMNPAKRRRVEDPERSQIRNEGLTSGFEGRRRGFRPPPQATRPRVQNLSAIAPTQPTTSRYQDPQGSSTQRQYTQSMQSQSQLRNPPRSDADPHRRFIMIPFDGSMSSRGHHFEQTNLGFNTFINRERVLIYDEEEDCEWEDYYDEQHPSTSQMIRPRVQNLSANVPTRPTTSRYQDPQGSSTGRQYAQPMQSQSQLRIPPRSAQPPIRSMRPVGGSISSREDDDEAYESEDYQPDPAIWQQNLSTSVPTQTTNRRRGTSMQSSRRQYAQPTQSRSTRTVGGSEASAPQRTVPRTYVNMGPEEEQRAFQIFYGMHQEQANRAFNNSERVKTHLTKRWKDMTDAERAVYYQMAQRQDEGQRQVPVPVDPSDISLFDDQQPIVESEPVETPLTRPAKKSRTKDRGKSLSQSIHRIYHFSVISNQLLRENPLRLVPQDQSKSLGKGNLKRDIPAQSSSTLTPEEAEKREFDEAFERFRVEMTQTVQRRYPEMNQMRVTDILYQLWMQKRRLEEWRARAAFIERNHLRMAIGEEGAPSLDARGFWFYYGNESVEASKKTNDRNKVLNDFLIKWFFMTEEKKEEYKDKAYYERCRTHRPPKLALNAAPVVVLRKVPPSVLPISSLARRPPPTSVQRQIPQGRGGPINQRSPRGKKEMHPAKVRYVLRTKEAPKRWPSPSPPQQMSYVETTVPIPPTRPVTTASVDPPASLDPTPPAPPPAPVPLELAQPPVVPAQEAGLPSDYIDDVELEDSNLEPVNPAAGIPTDDENQEAIDDFFENFNK
uniref:HMG box domain-containing protein n=1 Tax=Caenorhabditis tropicalis TaxID=1561998 RepID=A0A1I7T1H7_9PELO